ncbi:hypothetical protein OCAR_5349 [Afipia carboxidovorans OM5]|nr:hypothetical protein OCAR_5349 [Afipia carboxidovorans OM5]
MGTPSLARANGTCARGPGNWNMKTALIESDFTEAGNRRF